MNIKLTKLKEDWADLRVFLQNKMQVISDIKEVHDDEVETYKDYCDYLEPGSLKDKIVASIQKLDKATKMLQKPVSELVKKRDMLLVKRDREIQNNEE